MRILPVAVLCCWFGVASGFVAPAMHRLRPFGSPCSNSFCNRVGPLSAVAGRVPGSGARNSAVSALRAQLRQDEESQEDEAFPTVEVDRPSMWPLLMLPVPALSTLTRFWVLLHRGLERPPRAIGAESTCINLPSKRLGAESSCMTLLSKHVPAVVR